MKTTERIFVILMMLCSAVGLYAEEAPLPRPVVKIGVVLPITGNNSSLGENGRDGLLLKLKEINAVSNFEYRFIFEDDQFVFSKTAMAIQKFKNIDKVDVIMDLWGYSSNIAIPTLQKTSIIHLSADRWDEPPAYKYDMCAGAPTEDYVTPTVEALKALGIKRVGIFSFGEAGIQACVKELKRQMAQAGITMTEEMMATDQRDFRGWILKLRESKPEMLIAMSVMPTQEILLRQMKEMGYNLPLCGIGAGLWDVNPQYTEGAWFVDPSPAKEEFAAAFQQEFKREYRYPATQFYDAFTALVAAYEMGGGSKKPTSDQIIARLKNIQSLPGATGEINFATPNRLKTPLSYYCIINGAAEEVTLDTLIPQNLLPEK